MDTALDTTQVKGEYLRTEKGENYGKEGSASQRGVFSIFKRRSLSKRQKSTDFWIRLDSKARLVLPLEIRDSLGIEKNGKILLSVSQGQDGNFILGVAKARSDFLDAPEKARVSRNIYEFR